jgi:hypothetical protein
MTDKELAERLEADALVLAEMGYHAAASNAQQAAARLRQSEQEPVAWLRPDGTHVDLHKHPDYLPLYAAPQPQAELIRKAKENRKGDVETGTSLD